MLTADPRIIPTAVPVASVTFEEASELAYFGAKILHPISMQPAMAYNIPVTSLIFICTPCIYKLSTFSCMLFICACVCIHGLSAYVCLLCLSIFSKTSPEQQVRIKNSYNPAHPGTLISDRCVNRSPDRLVTAITIKRGQCLVDVVSTRMLGQHGFLARVRV